VCNNQSSEQEEKKNQDERPGISRSFKFLQTASIAYLQTDGRYFKIEAIGGLSDETT